MAVTTSTVSTQRTITSGCLSLIADATATDAVAPTAHSNAQVMETSELDGSDYIDRINAAHDHIGVLVDHPVPDPAGALVAVIAWIDQFTVQISQAGPLDHLGERSLVHTTPSQSRVPPQAAHDLIRSCKPIGNLGVTAGARG